MKPEACPECGANYYHLKTCSKHLPGIAMLVGCHVTWCNLDPDHEGACAKETGPSVTVKEPALVRMEPEVVDKVAEPPERIWIEQRLSDGYCPSHWLSQPPVDIPGHDPMRGVEYARVTSQPKLIAPTRAEAEQYLKSIGVELREDRILWAQFLATHPSIIQINIASTIALEERARALRHRNEGKETQ